MNTTPNYAGPLPPGWTGGAAKTKWWRGKHVHLYTLKKPCAECHREMTIDVTRGAIEGTAKNAGLHLARCPECRAKSVGTNSRPAVAGDMPWIKPEPTPEVEQLRSAVLTMTEELNGLYALNRELRDRLAKYELAPALAAIAGGHPWEV